MDDAGETAGGDVREGIAKFGSELRGVDKTHVTAVRGGDVGGDLLGEIDEVFAFLEACEGGFRFGLGVDNENAEAFLFRPLRLGRYYEKQGCE